jgi:hypothetical protein
LVPSFFGPQIDPVLGGHELETIGTQQSNVVSDCSTIAIYEWMPWVGQACTGVDNNGCCDISVLRGAVFKLSPAPASSKARHRTAG